MLNNSRFLFTYNGDEIKKNKDDFPILGQTVYNFDHNKIIAIKARIYFWNFKTPN